MWGVLQIKMNERTKGRPRSFSENAFYWHSSMQSCERWNPSGAVRAHVLWRLQLRGEIPVKRTVTQPVQQALWRQMKPQRWCSVMHKQMMTRGAGQHACKQRRWDIFLLTLCEGQPKSSLSFWKELQLLLDTKAGLGCKIAEQPSLWTWWSHRESWWISNSFRWCQSPKQNHFGWQKLKQNLIQRFKGVLTSMWKLGPNPTEE